MNRLKELRKQKGLTQQGLADKISVSKITVLRWENEERQIKPEKAQQLAEFFDVPIPYLLGFTDFRSTPKKSNKEDDELVQIGIDYFETITSQKTREFFEENILKFKKFPVLLSTSVDGDTKTLDNSFPIFSWLSDFYRTLAISPRELQVVLINWALLEIHEKDGIMKLIKELTKNKIIE